MYERVLFALDLEGVNNVVGKPYEGLAKGSEEWEIARVQAVKEINAGATALFDAGVKKIAVWDNHGGGGNIDVSALDERIEYINHDFTKPRMSFAKGNFDCACFFGYHAMEGTLGGVLAHTMSSKEVQFYKLNGKYIGEIDMDSLIAKENGLPTVFFAGGDIACKQALRSVPGMVTVITKTEKGRNKAEFMDDDELFAEIKSKIVQAMEVSAFPAPVNFPAKFEKSFKRVEDAEKYLERLLSFGLKSEYLEDDIMGKDAHTVVTEVHDILEYDRCI